MKTNASKETIKPKENSLDIGFLQTFITTFSAVFIAELGDKTQVATMLMSADTGRPVYVFIAASLALILSSLIGVILGSYISSNISQTTFNKLAGIIMIFISIYIFYNVFNSYFFEFRIR